ncbi:MAG: hypothetical protein Q8P38_02440 [Candidatus Nanopelagicales bacterium]|nr:hypothetical protein [Candidatus Nanopelagicales bacterium]
MASGFQVELRPSFVPQYRKLPQAQQRLVDNLIRDLAALVNLGSPRSEEARALGRRLRVKPIQRSRRVVPKRMEATYSANGRVVWTLDGDHLVLLYVGDHSVLEQS